MFIGFPERVVHFLEPPAPIDLLPLHSVMSCGAWVQRTGWGMTRVSLGSGCTPAKFRGPHERGGGLGMTHGALSFFLPVPQGLQTNSLSGHLKFCSGERKKGAVEKLNLT